MGHERVGVLPKTKRWRRIVGEIEAALNDDLSIAELADSVLGQVNDRFRKIHEDTGVQSTFTFLVAVPLALSNVPSPYTQEELGITSESSVFELVRALSRWVRGAEQSLEYAGLAQRAASDALSEWVRKHGQTTLFGSPSSGEVWAEAATARGFCELARSFFASFTERYLNYFLDRAASAAANSLHARNVLAESIEAHVAEVSRHALETSRITQSFAAGWFNKHVLEGDSWGGDVGRFLSIAFGKLREEILREAGGG